MSINTGLDIRFAESPSENLVAKLYYENGNTETLEFRDDIFVLIDFCHLLSLKIGPDAAETLINQVTRATLMYVGSEIPKTFFIESMTWMYSDSQLDPPRPLNNGDAVVTVL